MSFEQQGHTRTTAEAGGDRTPPRIRLVPPVSSDDFCERCDSRAPSAFARCTCGGVANFYRALGS